MLLQERWMLVFCGCMALAMFGQGMFNALLTIFAEHIMNPETYGWYLSTQGIGGVLVGKYGKSLRSLYLLTASLSLSDLVLLLQVNFPLLSIALVTSTILGIFVVGWIVGLQTILQQAVNPAYLGRIIGIYGTTQVVALLIGTSGGSLLGTIWGIVPALNLAASLLILAGIVVFLFRGNFETKKETNESVLAPVEERKVIVR